MEEIKSSVSSAVGSMARNNVIWHSKSSYTCDGEDQSDEVILVGNMLDSTDSWFLDYAAKVMGCIRNYSPAIKLPVIAANRHSVSRVKRVARAARPAVRQTFAARKAAKAADSGGGSSDPDGRRPQTYDVITRNIYSALPISPSVFGGAK